MENNETLKAKAEILLNSLNVKQNLININTLVNEVENAMPTCIVAVKSHDMEMKDITLEYLLTVVPNLLTIIKTQSEALNAAIDAMAELYGDLSNND